MAAGRDLWNEDDETRVERPAGPVVAVALEQADGAQAPKVVATGRGDLAEQILQLAFANGVKVRTDPDLAQILSAVEVDTIIPIEAFAAVAEILAHVYRVNGTPDMAAEMDKGLHS